MLANPAQADEGGPIIKMSSKNEVIKFDVVVVGSCMTDLVRYSCVQLLCYCSVAKCSLVNFASFL